MSVRAPQLEAGYARKTVPLEDLRELRRNNDGRFAMKGWEGEAMLLRWSESNTAGRTVTFQLPDDEEEHPFRGLVAGKKVGQRFKLYAVYEEEAGPGNIFPEEAERKEREKSEGERAVQRAGILCGDPEFQRWLMGAGADMHDDPQGWAADHIRKQCGIASRSELRDNTEARKRFEGIEADFKHRDTRR